MSERSEGRVGEIAAAVEKQLHALTKTSILHSTESAATGILNNSATRWLHSLDRSPLVFFLPQIITELCKPHGYQLLSYLTYDSRMHAPCTPLFTHPAKGTFPADMLKYVVTKQ